MRADRIGITIVAGLVIAYFLVFPDDGAAVLGPIGSMLNAIPTPAYGLASVVIVCLTAYTLLRPRIVRSSRELGVGVGVGAGL